MEDSNIADSREDLKIIRSKELAELLSVSEQTVWRLSKSEDFPPKVRIGNGRAMGWLESQIRSWIEARTESKESVAA